MRIETRNYKDTVFKLLFNNKLYLLELYNAINGTSYNNPDDLEITTLEGETFLKMKNDLSFIIDFELNLFAHPASKCPNIPLRDLYYVAATYRERIPHEKTFSSNPVKIPAPRFYMFYNGETDLDDTVTYRLSELFQKPVEEPPIARLVTCLNANEGHNKELMEACTTLNGYSIFVSKVRKYREKGIAEYDISHSVPLKHLADNSEAMKEIVAFAVNTAIEECIDEDVLRNFFVEYREEVTEVAILEYSAERHIQYEKEDSYKSGYDTGYDTGHNSGVKDTTDLFSWLKQSNRESDILRAVDDPEFLEKLFDEFSNDDIQKS